MGIIHLFTPKRGVRFYRKVKKILNENLSSNIYKVFQTKGDFFHILEDNFKEYDVVLITAHGADDSIITPIRENGKYTHNREYIKYITIEDTHKFINDFVFAVACSTASQFGPKTIENGAISFLGYDILIENLFKVSDLQISKDVRKIYENIAKRIFVEELAQSILKFIDEFQTVKMLKQSFAFRLEKRLINFFKMNADEIYIEYNYKIDVEKWKKNKPKLNLLQLDFLREVNAHLVYLGDSEYISNIGFERDITIPNDILARLEQAKFKDKGFADLFRTKLEKYKSA